VVTCTRVFLQQCELWPRCLQRMSASEHRRILGGIGIQKKVKRSVSFLTDAFTAQYDLLCGILERLSDVFVNMQGKNKIVLNFQASKENQQKVSYTQPIH
jgi:hypothetical protein